MDRPIPHPQQPSNPSKVGMQKVTWPSIEGPKIPRPTRARVQMYASRGTERSFCIVMAGGYV